MSPVVTVVLRHDLPSLGALYRFFSPVMKVGEHVKYQAIRRISNEDQRRIRSNGLTGSMRRPGLPFSMARHRPAHVSALGALAYTGCPNNVLTVRSLRCELNVET
jgi:hypothetical protein